jgi:lysozyme
VTQQISIVLNAFAPLVRKYEGLRLKAYLCPAGIPTIGYGHTKGVKLGQSITEEVAEEMLAEDMTTALHATLVLCPILTTESPQKIAAIADFTFNLGSGRLKASTLRRRINAGEYNEVPYELRRWVRAGPRILAGLVARRESEVQLWLSEDVRESTIGKESGGTGTSMDSVPFAKSVTGLSGRLRNTASQLFRGL